MFKTILPKLVFITIFLFCSSAKMVYGQALQPKTNAELLYSYELTKTAFCSDGSDRARDGIPRFDGPMEGIGITYKNYQYVSYYESNGEIIVARRNLQKPDSWEKSTIQNHKMILHDRHRRIEIGISKGDGVIHLAFDHHNTPVFNYAMTAVGVADNPESISWDNSVFKLVPNLGLSNTTGLVTYPSFIQLEETGNLIVYWRTGGSVGGEMNLAHYNSQFHEWSFIGQISSRDGYYNGLYGTRGPYHAGFKSDAEGNIHVAWLWREEEKLRGGLTYQYGNHGLFYANSNDGGFTWFKNNGNQVANTNLNQRISIDNIGETVADIPMELEASNAQIYSAFDTLSGELHVFSTHYLPNTTTKKAHQYIRSANGEWTKRIAEIPGGGGTLKFTDSLLFCFTGTKIYYSKRTESFTNWKEIKLNHSFPSGISSWDIDRIHSGIISLILQRNPTSLGAPSPLIVYDFKIADINKESVIQLASPLKDTVVSEGYNLQVKVDLVKPEKKIEHIRLYVDGKLVRQIDSPPYLWGGINSDNPDELNNLLVGDYLIKAISTDSAGKNDEVYFILKILERKIEACKASSSTHESGRTPDMAIDNVYSPNSYWSGRGLGATLTFDLCKTYAIQKLGITWLYGDRWPYKFDIAISYDSLNWTTVFSGQSSGTTDKPEIIQFPLSTARYIRYIGNGNTLSSLNAVIECDFYGEEANANTETHSEKTLFVVYPNPAIDVIAIELKEGVKAEIVVFNMMGQIVYQLENATKTVKLHKSKNNLTYGTYHIKVKIKNKVYTHKVVLL